jgi:hypothetical protein
VKFPSGARLVSSISIRRDMRRSRYRAESRARAATGSTGRMGAPRGCQPAAMDSPMHRKNCFLLR